MESERNVMKLSEVNSKLRGDNDALVAYVQAIRVRACCRGVLALAAKPAGIVCRTSSKRT